MRHLSFAIWGVLLGLVALSSATSTVNLRNYYNEKLKDHIYTIHPEKLGQGKDGYVLQEGFVAAVFPFRQEGTVGFERYYNAKEKIHYYTINPSEMEKGKGMNKKGDWGLEGTEGYIFPPTGSRVEKTKPLYRLHSSKDSDNVYTTNANEVKTKNGFKSMGIVGYVL